MLITCGHLKLNDEHLNLHNYAGKDRTNRHEEPTFMKTYWTATKTLLSRLQII